MFQPFCLISIAFVALLLKSYWCETGAVLAPTASLDLEARLSRFDRIPRQSPPALA